MRRHDERQRCAMLVHVHACHARLLRSSCPEAIYMPTYRGRVAMPTARDASEEDAMIRFRAQRWRHAETLCSPLLISFDSFDDVARDI